MREIGLSSRGHHSPRRLTVRHGRSAVRHHCPGADRGPVSLFPVSLSGVYDVSTNSLAWASGHRSVDVLSNARICRSALLIENVTRVLARAGAAAWQSQRAGARRAHRRRQRSANPAPADARRLDGTGKFLTPGLTDAHVHVSRGDRPAVRVDESRARRAREGFLRAAAAQLSVLRRDAAARPGQPDPSASPSSPRSRSTRTSSVAARRPWSTAIHSCSWTRPSATRFSRLHLRARERARASAARRAPMPPSTRPKRWWTRIAASGALLRQDRSSKMASASAPTGR